MTAIIKWQEHTCDDETDALALGLRDGGKGLDSEANVLLPLEAVDAEDNLIALEDLINALSQILLLGARVDAGVDDAHGGALLQLGPRLADDATRELRVDGDGLGKAHAPLLNSIKGNAVEALEEGGIAAAGEEQVGEVAVEEDRGGGAEVGEEG